MAEGKKSFVAYSDWDGMFKALPDDVAGKLIKHIFSYVNDQNPESDDFVINALFEQIKATLKRDLKKWDTQREQRSEAGKKSAELRASTKSNERSIPLNETQRNPTVSVSVSVSVNTTTNNSVIKFEDAVKICLFDENWKEDVERVYKIDRNKIHLALTDFTNHCGTIGEKTDKSLKNFQKHFTNWVRIKKQYAI